LRKEDLELIEAWINGELSIHDIIEEAEIVEDLSELLDYEPFVSLGIEDKGEYYEVSIYVEHKDFGVTSGEVEGKVNYYRSEGFKDYGTTSHVLEDIQFWCKKCRKSFTKEEVGFDWDRQFTITYKCPDCREELETEEVYDHVHYEGSKTVKIEKKKFEEIIEKSETLRDFIYNLADLL